MKIIVNMKNQIDFLKIYDGIWGAINLNNMIPIHKESIEKVNIKILESDVEDDIAYKNLLSNQLSWCNANYSKIILQATKLYHSITSGKARPELKNRCCNFLIDENLCAKYKLKDPSQR